MSHSTTNQQDTGNTSDQEQRVLSRREKATVLAQALVGVGLVWWLCWADNFEIVGSVLTGIGHALLGIPLGLIASVGAVVVYLKARGVLDDIKPLTRTASDFVLLFALISILLAMFGGAAERYRIDELSRTLDSNSYLSRVYGENKVVYFLKNGCEQLSDNYTEFMSDPEAVDMTVNGQNPGNACGYWVNKIELSTKP